jgi:hypothetical protein
MLARESEGFRALDLYYIIWQFKLLKLLQFVFNN